MLSAAAVAAALVPLSLVFAPPVHAQTPAPLPLSEDFTDDATDNNWFLPDVQVGGEAATNPACLTDNSNEVSNSPIPTCIGGSIVAGLRLTNNALDTVGGVAYGVPLSTAKPLDFTFNTYQYKANGEAGDGIAFFLAAVDPAAASASPFNLGPGGGRLGYSGVRDQPARPARASAIAVPSVTQPGVPHAYLGVGFDVFGNFSDADVSGEGCSESGVRIPQSVVVRGPGDQGTGYCRLQSQSATGRLDAPFYGSSTPESAPRQEAAAAPLYPGVPVEVVLNPRNTVIETDSGFAVPGRSLGVRYTSLEGPEQTMIQALPGTAGGQVLPNDVIPPAWLNAGTGIPQQLLFGFSAGTGSAGEIHTISDLNVDAVTGPELRFTNQPVDTAVNQDMKSPDNTTRHVKVTAYTGDPTPVVDTAFSGNVTLAFQDAPSGANFIVGGSPTTTMTATAVNGVADFSPVKIDTAGFDYTLLATGAAHFGAVSKPFTVAEAAKSCTGTNCQITPPPADDGTTGTVNGQKGDIITATFGGDVEPLLGCDELGKTYTDILTVTGVKPKVVKIHAKPALVPNGPRVKICFSSPKPFTVLGGTDVAQQNPANDNWYEGYLPSCQKFPNGPCIRTITWTKTGGETATIYTGGADPRFSL
jgi:hypothetical protein